ncbi:MAG: Glioma tumor suppressor candidate region protein 2 [Trizodia sp. TS-e1964]|nr:MAG: Glioma tumor suppressor candidate region protein 2 [Trizodia sp. TS-e1964]
MASLIEESLAPRQLKQPSRKGKAAWRKNIDITDIQEGLETVRVEEIHGGVIAELPSDFLFSVDVQGSRAIQRSYLKNHKPLRSDEILAQRSAVPAVCNRKHPLSRTTDGVYKPSAWTRDKIPYKDLVRLRKIANKAIAPGEHEYLNTKHYIQGTINPNFDLWSSDSTLQDGQLNSQYSFLPAPSPPKPPKTLKQPPNTLIKNGKRMAAVKKPIGGQSYNPLSLDYDELLQREVRKEISAERQRLAAAEREHTRLERQEQIAAESEGSDVSDEQSSWEGIESEAEPAVLSQKLPERKTKTERNKIARRREAQRQALHEMKMKHRKRQQSQIASIARAIKAQERSRAERARQIAAAAAAESDESGDDSDSRIQRRCRPAKSRLPSKPLELVLPDELEDSLRRLRPEGSLLSDRFRNLLVRGKMEVRKPVGQTKKAKRKTTEKWTYKDFELRY